jgi:hypothetical protein
MDAMDPIVNRKEDGEAAESLKKVEEHLAGEDGLLKELEQQIQEAERKRHQTFDPST